MRFLDLYYLIKPAIPQPARMRIRALLAGRQRCRFARTWPVDEASALRPRDWTSWPNGKKFAFVLTHDVEGVRGLERCRALASLEMDYGFRSSFNFVPEGEYQVDASCRQFLRENEFEVGVHDLHHDGSLYRSEAAFRAAATKINTYLKDWGAVGFRSAFMLHNLEWLKQLDVLYDASTFDTDPFEPQPDAAGTIFPFLVKRADGSSYVELPYTLAQDSTLYFVLREKTNDLWKRKLDWIAEQGGMALVNVHPDYIAFDNRPRATEFPLALYEDFLSCVRSQYGDSAWCALPRDVAHFIQDQQMVGRTVLPSAWASSSSPSCEISDQTEVGAA